MQSIDGQAFQQLLTNIGMLYGETVHEKVLETWWGALEHLEFAEVKVALKVHVRNPDTGQYMPKPADVMRCLRGDSKTQALQAWSKVEDAICSQGAYASLVFDDALIHAVIEEMGGWVRLCHTLLKDLPFRAHDFEKRYAAYVLHPPPRYPKQLIGLEAQQNNLYGYAAKNPPLLVGNSERALQVFQSGGDKPVRVRSLNALLESFGEAPSSSAISHPSQR